MMIGAAVGLRVHGGLKEVSSQGSERQSAATIQLKTQIQSGLIAMTQVVLHIGMHKTGSTAIQKRLEDQC